MTSKDFEGLAKKAENNVRLSVEEKALMRAHLALFVKNQVRAHAKTRHIFQKPISIEEPKGFFVYVVKHWYKPVLRFASVSVAVFVLVIGVSGGMVYASPGVTSGDSLYGVKLWMESKRLSFADTPLERVRLHAAFSLRRLEEAKILVHELGTEKGEESVARFGVYAAHAAQESPGQHDVDNGNSRATNDPLALTVAAVVAHTRAALHEAAELADETERFAAVAVIVSAQEVQYKGLVEIAGEVGARTQGRVVDVIALALEDTASVKEAAVVRSVIAPSPGLRQAATGTVATEALSGVDSGTAAQQLIAQQPSYVTEIVAEVEQPVAAATSTTPIPLIVRELVAVTGTPKADPVGDAPQRRVASGAESADAQKRSREVRIRLDEARAAALSVRQELLADGASENDLNRLFERVGLKLHDAQDSLEQGDIERVQDLLKETTALTKNAKHFAKILQREVTGNSRNEREDDGNRNDKRGQEPRHTEEKQEDDQLKLQGESSPEKQNTNAVKPDEDRRDGNGEGVQEDARDRSSGIEVCTGLTCVDTPFR